MQGCASAWPISEVVMAEPEQGRPSDGISRRRLIQAAGVSVGAMAVVPGLLGSSAHAATPSAALEEAALPTAAPVQPPIELVAGGDKLTTNLGVKISDDQNTLRAGVRGPSLLEDFAFR